MVITDQEVMTGDIQIVDLNEDGSFEKYGKSQRIINIFETKEVWELEV